MKKGMDKTQPSPPEADACAAAHVLAVLEPEQLSHARHSLPRRRLTRWEIFLLWSLRAYLLFMLGVVAYEAWVGVSP
jgi:hypothetical protein